MHSQSDDVMLSELAERGQPLENVKGGGATQKIQQWLPTLTKSFTISENTVVLD